MFKNRTEAGRLLAEALQQHRQQKGTLVLGIPRGGVVVAWEVAQQLGLPVDVIVIKKIGFPGQEEFAVGAVGLDDYILNEGLMKRHDVSAQYLHDQIRLKQYEARQRHTLLRGDKPPVRVQNQTILLIDDGLATGTTMAMAVRIVEKQHPRQVIVAIPVAPPDAVSTMEKLADIVVCLHQPSDFRAVGHFYGDFREVTDEEVRSLLRSA